MEFLDNNSKGEWDEFVEKNSNSFLQSFDWGEFKKSYQGVWRVCIRDKENKIIGACQLFEEKRLFQKYLYIPHGPIAEKRELREKLINNVAKKIDSNSFFIKVEPERDISIGKKALRRVQPQETSVIDIDKEMDDILMNFRKSTRYNVRNAKKNGIIVEKSKDCDIFFNLIKETTERQQFNSYNKKYFKELLDKTDSTLFVAKQRDKVISASIILFFGKTAFYLHSASSIMDRRLNATSYLIFESINEAKRRGCLRYDLWGIDRKKFPGVTTFKKGFGGEDILYPNAVDLPIQINKYRLYLLLVKLFKR